MAATAPQPLAFYSTSFPANDASLEGQTGGYPAVPASGAAGSWYAPGAIQPGGGGIIGGGIMSGGGGGGTWDANEPPLLDELGVNFDHIWKKSLAVLNPRRALDKEILDDDDLAGPLLFCLLFGSCLLLSGKIHFGYIYGVALIGCVGLYFLLNMMSESGINGTRTTSILGYCLLPMALLALLSAVLNLQGPLGLVVAALTVSWCTYAASTMFVTVLQMTNQRLLVAYPVAVLYSSFALLTVF